MPSVPASRPVPVLRDVEGGAGATCALLLDQLPTWFGIPEANEAYVAAADTNPSVIASVDGIDVGITTLTHHSPYAAEVHLMAVAPAHHRHGIGTAMLRHVERRLADAGVEFLQVKTLSPAHPDVGYAATRAFYLAYGFRPLEEFPALWDERSPALQMIKTVAPHEPPDGSEERYRDAERRLWATHGGAPAEHTLRLARTGASVRVQQLGAGPPLVFVHGASNAGTSWAPLVCRLPDLRCVVVDRPGCGLSPPLAASLGDMAALGAFADAFVIDVLDALDVDRAAVVGTSFGGYHALRAAAAHPDRISALVVLGWPFGAPAAAVPLLMRAASRPRLRRLATRIPPTEWMVRRLLQQIGLQGALESGRFGGAEMAWFQALLRDTPTMRNEIDAAPSVVTMRGLNADTLLPTVLLQRVSVPSLFLWGRDDPMGGADVARPFVAQVPGARLDLLAGAGHAPWIDDPVGVAQRLQAFIAADH
jgi:2-hydroxy-6-oxonona-2,4-dienedioate hydrolase